MAAPVCDHPNWHSNQRSRWCLRRARTTCDACGTPTCGTHLVTLRDGRRCCRRGGCMKARIAKVVA